VVVTIDISVVVDNIVVVFDATSGVNVVGAGYCCAAVDVDMTDVAVVALSRFVV